MCVCVCLHVFLCVSVFEHLWEFVIPQSLSSVLLVPVILLLLQLFLYLLLPCTARCPRIWFPIVGPAVSPLSYFLKMLPLLVSWAVWRAKGWDVLHRSRKALINLVNASILPRPNLLTNLVDRVQVRVIHQLHEVPVPKLLIGHWRPPSAAGVWSRRCVRG